MRRLLAGLILLLGSSVACAAPADDLKALVEQHKMTEAYNLGISEPDNFGDPAFDFYFGIAAIDAGAPGEGVLALERYVLQFPENRNARLNLARGYFVLGEDERARDEFQTLRPDASGEEAANIDRFLEAIQLRESRFHQTVAGFIEGGIGYDSNLNAGVSSGSLVNIPGLIAAPQAPNSISNKTGDAFASIAAGAQITRPVAPGIAIFGAVSLDSRTYERSRDDVFNQIDYGVSGGATYLAGRDLFRGTASLGEQLIGGQNYVLVEALAAGWVRQQDQFNRFSVDVSVGRQNFDNIMIYGTLDKTGPEVSSGSNLETNNFGTVSGSWTRNFAAMWDPSATLTAGYTHENNIELRPDYSRDVYTLRGQVRLTPVPRWSVVLGTTYFHDDYLGNYALISSAARHDDNVGVDATATYQITREWSGRIELNWNEENSNVGLFDYDRTAVALKLRYEFN
jgi:hypothetical protein